MKKTNAAKGGAGLVVVAVPFTFVDRALCPLEQVSSETLRFIGMLRAGGGSVRFINMRSTEKYLWKTRKAGLGRGVDVKMAVCSKPLDFLEKELAAAPPTAEILLWCDFPFSPYIFDIDVIRSLMKVCRAALPGAAVKVGGAFWEMFPGQAATEGFEVYRLAEGAVDAFEPDLEASLKEPYGLFQLSKGCVNNCSFCVAGRTRPRKFGNSATLAYMRRLAKAGITDFWNWDQNVLMYPRHVEEFLDAFLASGIEGTLNFSLGFQPDRITRGLIERLARLKIGILTVPFETGTSAALRMVGKPYTIISSIKRTAEIKRYAGRAVKRLHCSFIIGYKHDDLRSIFRIYLSVLRLHAVPIPFPLYLFPNTGEYARNAAALAGREITALHGQLWPLVPAGKVAAYTRLLRFLAIDDLPRALRSTALLAPEMLAAFKEELAINEAFVAMCLGSTGESAADLVRIEKKLASPELRRPNVLHISVSPRPAGRSVSKDLGDYFCGRYAAGLRSCRVDRLDLSAEPLEFINDEYTRFIAHEAGPAGLSARTRRQVALSDKYITLLRNADRIVISTPMYTLSIPSVLKCFFELVASRLFYELNDKLAERKICCVLSRDGVYGRDPKMRSIQEDSLATALGFIGLAGEIRYSVAQGLSAPGGRAAAMAASRKELDLMLPWFRAGLAGPGK